MRCAIALIALVLSWSIPLSAQDTGLSFLRIGMNATAGAMGDAHISATRNAFATYWNPAGLASASNSLAGSHRLWVGDVRAYDVTARLPAGGSAGWGLALTATDSGELEARNAPGPADGTFSAQFISLGTSYARAIGTLRIGATIKYLRERIYENSASGYGLDAGLQLDLWGERFTLGGVLRNAGRMTELENQRTQLPTTIQGGWTVFPFQIIASADGARLLELMASLEVSLLIDGGHTRVHGGLSATVMELVDLRGGYVSGDELRSFTFGVGLDFESILVDYAYVPFADGFEGPGHLLSVLYAW